MRFIQLIFSGIILLNLICFCSKHDINRTIVLQALNIVKEHSINSKNLNWTFIEKDILKQSNQLKSEEDLYKVLQNLINHLDDKLFNNSKWKTLAKNNKNK